MFKFLYALLVAFFKPANSVEESKAEESKAVMDPIELKKRIMSIDPAALAAANAELEAEENDPDFQPEPVKLRDDSDPWNMDLAWLYPDVEKEPPSPDS